MATLKIDNLHVMIEGLEILKGVNLVVNTNEFHAIMGPNGNGKSTLLNTIMGHPKYQITEGKIYLDDVDITDMSIDEKSRLGIFLGMQSPIEISGVTNFDFLRAAINSRHEKPVSLFKFIKQVDQETEKLKMNPDLAQRYLNEGFSGGEKKRNEILQMNILKPKFALLDEIDSGLDVDALHIISDSINAMKSDEFGCVIVSHYERLFELVPPTHVHVLIDGKIVKSGDYEIIKKIDNDGYKWLKDDLGIDIDLKEIDE